MGLIDKMRTGIRSWLRIDEADPTQIQITEIMDFEGNAIKNQIWYRGDSEELQQLYQQINTGVDSYKFWACKCTEGMEIRKIHTGLPKLIIKILASIVMPDLNTFEFKEEKHRLLWQEIENVNNFRKTLSNAIKKTLVIGDGAFKLSLDATISEYPIIEFYSGERVEYIYNRGKIKEIIFKIEYREGQKQYTLNEHYGYGYVYYKLYHNDKEVNLSTIKVLKNLSNADFDKSLIMAVPFMIYESSKWDGRGESIFDGKVDAFDAFDEAWSQWMDAVRAGRSKTYMPDELIPKNTKTGEYMKPNSFDNRFIKVKASGFSEEGKGDKIEVVQPIIPHDSYLATYITALDQCIQGVISPSTLGIDIKKLDNAEAQREKEKATLYTRNAIIEVLRSTIPLIINATINTHYYRIDEGLEEIKIDIPFGEYANPSFESQVETVGKGRTQGIMSIEACVDELYGDTKKDDWKEEEIKRLKNEQGIMVVDEPSTTGADNIIIGE